jgi:hypothetical protein
MELDPTIPFRDQPEAVRDRLWRAITEHRDACHALDAVRARDFVDQSTERRAIDLCIEKYDRVATWTTVWEAVQRLLGGS